MTPPESGGGHAWAIGGWLLVGAVIFAVVSGVVGGVLSRALVVDAVALWPLFLGGIVLGTGIWALARRWTRRGGFPPLVVFSTLILACGLHLSGWDALPSATARLTGPGLAGIDPPVSLAVRLEGELGIDDGPGAPLYRIDPILRGGGVGAPEATEIRTGGNLAIELGQVDAPGWYRFAGWELRLSPATSWDLALGGELDADMRSLAVTSADLAGEGEVRLGPPPFGGQVTVRGDITLMVPADAPAQVRGPASVPADWPREGNTATSPADGPGWTIIVAEGGRLVVVSE